MTSLLIALKIIPMIFTALFPVVNPIGTALVLYGMTREVDDQTWKSMSRKIALYSFLLLCFFLFLGSYILRLFGISIPVVQFSGGIVLALMGWQLLSQKEASEPNTQVGLDNPSQSIDADAKTFYPFTFPLTIGPGGMAVVFTFSAHFNQESLLLVSLEKGAAVIGIFLVCVVVFLCYRNLHYMTKRFSHAGALAIHRHRAALRKIGSVEDK